MVRGVSGRARLRTPEINAAFGCLAVYPAQLLRAESEVIQGVEGIIELSDTARSN